MSLDNPWFVLAVLAVVLLFHLELITTLLNLAQFGKPLPDSLRSIYSDEQLQRCADYHRRSASLEMTQTSVSFVALVVFWWSGGFGWLDTWSRALGWGEVASGLFVIACVFLAQWIVSMPFEIWETFQIEADFKFNRTTPATFIKDRLKGLMLAAGLGVPLLALLLWFFATQSWAAVYAWATITAFSLLMLWASPRFIMPLFLQFKPLPDGPLKAAVLGLAERLQFPVADVCVVDGSRRSTKANAFFAGVGRNRRIALFDTLIDQHQQDELLAVLAHEIGHAKLGHVPKHLALSLIENALLFALLHFALHSPGFFAAFGVANPSVGLGFLVFAILYRPVSMVTGWVGSAMSRRHEFDADAFAAQSVGSAQPLATALQALATDHLAHPQPHPLTVQLFYSHPPLAERLNALQAVGV